MTELEQNLESQLFHNILTLVNKSERIRLVDSNNSKYKISEDMFSFIDLPDKRLFKIGYGEIDKIPDKSVKIATIDHDVCRNTVESYLGCLNESQIQELIRVFFKKRNPVERWLFYDANKNKLIEIASLVFSTIVLVSIYFVLFDTDFQNYIFYHFRSNELIYVMIGVTLTVSMYIFKEEKIIYYGSVEVIIGLLACRVAFEKYDSNFIIKLFGGLYIMVRGLDNISKDGKVKEFYRRKKQEIKLRFLGLL